METYPLRQLDTSYLEQPPFFSSTPLPAGWDLSEFLGASQPDGQAGAGEPAAPVAPLPAPAAEVQPAPHPACAPFPKLRTLPHRWDLSEFA